MKSLNAPISSRSSILFANMTYQTIESLKWEIDLTVDYAFVSVKCEEQEAKVLNSRIVKQFNQWKLDQEQTRRLAMKLYRLQFNLVQLFFLSSYQRCQCRSTKLSCHQLWYTISVIFDESKHLQTTFGSILNNVLHDQEVVQRPSNVSNVRSVADQNHGF